PRGRRGRPHPPGHRIPCAGDDLRGSGMTSDTAASGGPVEDGSRLAGVPDEFQRLWTPHRMAYIQAGPEVLREGCRFWEAPKHPDAERLIVARGETAYVLLSLFPYHSGHLLVCPYRHIATYDEATPEEVAEIGS